MDGTNLAVADDGQQASVALVPNGPDALSRIVCFGHALRTVEEYLSGQFFDEPAGPVLEMMNGAFDRLANRRPGFSPEEFTLLVMSSLVGRCTDPDEQVRYRRGAAAYILRAAPKLPDDYAPIVEDARRLLSRATGVAQTTRASDGPLPAIIGNPNGTPARAASATKRPMREPQKNRAERIAERVESRVDQPTGKSGPASEGPKRTVARGAAPSVQSYAPPPAPAANTDSQPRVRGLAMSAVVLIFMVVIMMLAAFGT